MHRVNIFTAWILALILAPAAFAEPVGRFRITTQSTPIPNTSIKRVSAEAHFPHAVAKVWDLFNQLETFPRFIPRLESLDVMAPVKGKEQVYVRAHVPAPMPNLWNVLAVTRKPKEHRIEWKMVSGNVKENTGHFELKKEGSGTRIKVSLYADPGGFLPGLLVNWGTERYLPTILNAIGERLDALHSLPLPRAGKGAPVKPKKAK